MLGRVSLRVNGTQYEEEVDVRRSLVDFLREDLRLTGTHIGCRTGNCGACTVVLDGKTVKSCCILAMDAVGMEVKTIEGISPEFPDLHPVQQAFVNHQGLQCGYCTPGVVLSTMELLAANSQPTRQAIRRSLAGNLCRCTGYQFIVEAVEAAAQAL